MEFVDHNVCQCPTFLSCMPAACMFVVRMYVCMHACMYVRMHACMHVCMYAGMHACAHELDVGMAIGSSFNSDGLIYDVYMCIYT